MAQATIKYVGGGVPVDEIRPGMHIPTLLEPYNSYVDSDVYVNGHEGEDAASTYGKSIYATNVHELGTLPGLLPLASTPIKFAYFEMAIRDAMKAVREGEAIPTITVEIENEQDKLWWLQMAPHFVSSGFFITVDGQPFGGDVQTEENPENPEDPEDPENP